LQKKENATCSWVIPMLEIFNEFVIRGLIGMIFVSFLAPIGVLADFRGVSYLPAEVSHAALGGAAIGFLLIYLGLKFLNPIVFAILFSLGVSLLTAYLIQRKGLEAAGSAIGSGLALSMSFYALVRSLLPGELKVMLDNFLIGDVLLLSTSDIVELFIMVLISLIVFFIFFKEFLFLSFDYEGLEAIGLNVKFYDYILFLLLGFSGVIETKTVGAFLVFAFMIAPAGIARELSNDVSLIFFLSFLIALTSSFFGLFVSLLLNLPTSGVVAMIPSSIYIGLVIKKIFKS